MNKTLKYKGFTGSIEISIEDNCLHGKILFIDGLVTYEAETISSLQDEFKAAVDDYLETCREHNIQPKKPCSGTFNIRIGPDLHLKAAEEAYRLGIKLNDFVKVAVREKVESGDPILHHHLHTVVYKTKIFQRIQESELGYEGNTVTGYKVSTPALSRH